MTAPAVFAAAFAALYVAHQVGDHWVQREGQALGKTAPGWPGRLDCLEHVAGLVACKVVALLLVGVVTGLPLSPWFVAVALAADGAAHYWADRRSTLARLAELAGKGEFWQLGQPRPGHDDAPHLGTGAYALDQSWHVAWLFVAALIIAGGAR
jgi:hypothetical protein